MRSNEEVLLNAFPYENTGAIKKVIRILPQLMLRAQDGDQAASALVMDLSHAMRMQFHLGSMTYRSTGTDIISEKQQQVLWLHLVLGFSQRETAMELAIQPQSVDDRIKMAIGRISKYLTTGYRGWTWAEDDFIKAHFKEHGPEWVSQELDRPLRQVYNRYHYLRGKGRIA